MRLLHAICLCAILVIASAPTQAAVDHSHAALSTLLGKHVQWSDDGHASRVDYVGLKAESAALQAYLKQLAAVTQADFDGWNADQRMAFLINAYNAWTLDLILTGDADLVSIKDLGSLFGSPWKQVIAPLLGSTRSLDDIEHGLLRGAPDFAEPRIHFAVNCASIGCPALRPEAYTAAQLETQLADQTTRFLSDRSRNRVSADGDTLEVSKLFDWYADDFTSMTGTLAPPLGFLAGYAEQLSADPAVQQRIRAGELEIEFLDYDWSLNSVSAAAASP
ncbi:MAG: DUF547 domain-containing protein [Pseudomarimonas sp.]